MAHDHTHGMVGAKLRTAFFITLVVLGAEIVGALWSNSLALLSDAGHVLTDLVALGLAWFATNQAERPANANRTYGYHRVGILAALANAVTLILIVFWIGYEALERFAAPPEVLPGPLFAAAIVGLAANLYVGFALRAEASHNVNVRAAMLHVFGDVGASIAVIVGGVVMLATGWYLVDPILSVAIALLIAKGAWDVLRETVDVLMESAPRNMNIAQLVRDVMRLPHVKDVHDVHVWSIAGGMPVLSAHVQVDDDVTISHTDALLVEINRTLRERYGIAHTTIQFECAGCGPGNLYCTLEPHSHDGHQHAHAHGDEPHEHVGTPTGSSR